MQNPTLSDLIGGIESVTLSDEEARRRRTQKTVLERRAPPTFDSLVEIQASTAWPCTRTSPAPSTRCCAASTPRRRSACSTLTGGHRGGAHPALGVDGRGRRALRRGRGARARTSRARRAHRAGAGRPAAAHPRLRRQPRPPRGGDREHALGGRRRRQHPGRRRGDDAAAVLPSPHRPAADAECEGHPRLRPAQQHRSQIEQSLLSLRGATARARPDDRRAAARPRRRSPPSPSRASRRWSCRRRTPTSAACSTSSPIATAWSNLSRGREPFRRVLVVVSGRRVPCRRGMGRAPARMTSWHEDSS